MNVTEFAQTFDRIRTAVGSAVVGQREVVDGVIVAALSGGHALLEGAPGLAKTLVARSFARATALDFKRIQFTPDLMPSDVTGSSLYRREQGTFEFMRGPIFCDLMLADEINRAPAKTQSALLEAMQDLQVTVDGVSHPLPSPFIVLATQNPIESQGTYPLPEAQLDRFVVKLTIGDPPREVEHAVVRKHADGFDPTNLEPLTPVTNRDQLLAMKACARAVHVDDAVVGYAVDLVRRTRAHRMIEVGASPRASIALMRTAQVVAASQAREFVTPDDVKPMFLAVVRHRVLMHADAQLQGARVDDQLLEIIEAAPVPRTG